jgi:predicted AAA+ superfamily ATPase
MVHKKDMGKMGEALVAQHALERGLSVFVEFGDNSKIDLIIEDNQQKLHRVQVKVVTRSEKTPEVSVLYLYKSGPNYQFRYTTSDVDWFALIDDLTKKVAWIPSSICEEASSSINLRHAPTKIKQTKRIRMFDDYTNFPFE